MPPEVLVALIGAGQAITLAFIGVLTSQVGKVKRDAAEARSNSAAAREQVENDHRHPDGTVINMREENDSRHAETKEWIDGLRSDFAGRIATVGQDIGGLREEIRIDRSANNQRFQTIEERLNKEKP